MSPLPDRLRDVIDPAPARARPRPLLVGTILIAVSLLAVMAAISHDIPLINGKPGYAIAAEFAATNQVNDRTPVRVQGVNVGLVERVAAGRDPQRTSRMTMRITDEDLVVHRDARATIRWRTLLGGSMYIDLEPGSPRAPRLGAAVIPVEQTHSQVELDDVLRVYDGDTEQAQRDALKGYADSFGDPASAGRAITALPKLRTVGRGLAPLRGQTGDDLRRMVAATATTVQALGSDLGDLQTLVHGASATLGATNARREQLGAFLELSPPALDSTRTTMARLRTTLDHLDPLARNLRPGARGLAPAAAAARPALAEAQRLLVQARPVLRSARPAFADLRAASGAGVPIIKGLEPTVDRLNDDTLPYLAERDEQTRLRNYEAVGPHFSVLDMAAAEFDAEGFRLHLSTLGGSNSVTTAALAGFDAACRSTAPRAQRAQCSRIASVMTQGLVGGRRGRR